CQRPPDRTQQGARRSRRLRRGPVCYSPREVANSTARIGARRRRRGGSMLAMLTQPKLVSEPAELDLTTEEGRYRAVRTRDPRAEGRFFYAVVTTGVYCRPGCAA